MAEEKKENSFFIDINRLQQAEKQKGQQPPSQPANIPSTDAPQPPTQGRHQGGQNPNTPAPPQTKEQYILAVKEIILNFLKSFDNGTLIFTEKDKKKKPKQYRFIINKQKINLQETTNGTTVTHTYYVHTGQYLRDNQEKQFDETQIFIQTVLQPTFRWIADDKAVYTIKKNPIN